ncbi:hypothetical protein [Lutispora sp.]|uniref:hypothetical protein n=1 Tax=Lutispora sp. TaxID=2828727 RepID=UPI0035641D1B
MVVKENKQFEMLVESIQLLAAGYTIQASVLPDYVHIPDEIALTFDDTYIFAENLVKDNLINKEVKNELDNLNSLLEQMSSLKELWTMDSLEAAEAWQNVRELATGVLKMLGIEKQKPNLFWLEFVTEN